MVDLKKLESGLLEIAKNHNAEYVNNLFNEDGENPSFTILTCNVPTLADVRFLCEELEIDRECVVAEDGWGMIGIEIPKGPNYGYDDDGNILFKILKQGR